MKIIQSFFIVAALLLGPIALHAKNYYVSAAGNDANDGLTINTPWQNLKKINQFTFTPGDVILLRRGDTFYGSIIVPLSNLSFDAYGTGALPVLTGFTTLTSWTNTGGGIWNISVPGVKSSVNMVTLNGVAQEVGRWPNSDAANGGYLTDDSFSGNTQYTCAALNGTNWTGAEVVARLRGYLLQRNTISSQSGSTITYRRTIAEVNPHLGFSQSPTTPPDLGFGLFIQRDIRTLDKLGEWYFNPSTKVMSMYFGSGNPSSYDIKASSIDTCFNIGTHNNIAINNLDIEGYNFTGVIANDNSGISITNCVINNTGNKALFLWYCSGAVIYNNNITNSMCVGIDVEASPASLVQITYNTVKNIGMLKGMSQFYDPSDCLSIFAGGNSIVRHNSVDSSGYCGIRFEGQNISVDSNLVNHYCQTRNDGGGIYMQGESNSNSWVRNNIILNAGNPTEGTAEQVSSHGIYIDNHGGGVTILDNTISGTPGVAFQAGFGLFFNSPLNVVVQRNTVYNGNGWYVGKQYSYTQGGFVVKNNLIFTTTSSQAIMQHTHNGLNSTNSYVAGTIQQSLQKMGTIDSNYYSSPSTTAKPFSWYYAPTAGGAFTFPPAVNFTNWQSYSSQDAHTINIPPVASRFEYNPTSVNKTVSLGSNSYKDVYGKIYSGNIIIAPFTSKVLMDNGVAVNQVPIANGGSDKTITLPTNTTSLTGIGTDADGTITKYAWTKITGPASGTIATMNAAVTTLSGLVQGTYNFELAVTDNAGAIAKDSVKVIVNPASNEAPTANAGADKSITLPVNSVTLSGIGTDADGTVAKYAWTKITGPASGTIVTPDAAITSLSGLVQGSYNFELAVTDNSGAIARDSVQVIINSAPNQLPTVNAGTDKSIALPVNSTTLAGIATDVDGTIAKYTWTKIAGPASGTIATPAAAVTSLSGLAQGTYNFELSVTDNVGAIAKDSVKVIVNPTSNQAPTANAGTDKSITLPVNSVTLSGIGTDADGTIANYAWTKIAGPASGTIATPNAAITSLGSLVQGTYNFELAVTDNSGAITRDSVQVNVNPATNQAPIANAGPDQTITLPLKSTMLAGSGRDADGTISSYKWVKISGPSGGIINNAYTASTTVTGLWRGTYKYVLTVKDNSGLAAKDTMQLIVKSALKNSLSANAGTSRTVELPTNTTTLAGTTTLDSTVISSYSWIQIEGPSVATIVDPFNAVTIVKNLRKGNYKFEFVAKDNEENTAKDTVGILVEENHPDNKNNFSVFPNPVRNVANLEINTIDSKEITRLSVLVINLAGKTVARQNYAVAGSNNHVKLDMSDLMPGFYTVTAIFDNGKTCNVKIIKLSSGRW